MYILLKIYEFNMHLFTLMELLCFFQRDHNLPISFASKHSHSETIQKGWKEAHVSLVFHFKVQFIVFFFTKWCNVYNVITHSKVHMNNNYYNKLYSNGNSATSWIIC